jgi:lipoprotein signal peptidase
MEQHYNAINQRMWWLVFTGVWVSDRLSKMFAHTQGWVIVNTGGVLGLFPGVWWLIITGLIIFAVSWMSSRIKTKNLASLGLATILAAGLANWFDRLVFGGVWDWISYPTGIKGNLADICLGIGAVMLILPGLKKRSEG